MPAPTPPWWIDPPSSPEEMLNLLEARFFLLKSDNDEGQALRRLLKRLDALYDTALIQARAEFPLAFFKPSYEQALLLNCWAYGINFPVCFASNRIGKTTGFVFNALLYIFPNDPSWTCFQPYTDHLGRRVALLPRPRLQALVPLQRFYAENPSLAGNPALSIYEGDNPQKLETSQREAPGFFRSPYPAAPIQKDCSVWLGAPDKEWHKTIMMRRWRDWLPPASVLKWNTTDCLFTLSNRASTNPKPAEIEISCKSYESRDEKWSGDAVAGIMLSEGFSPEILAEVKNRVAPHAFASWDYTPVEARNVGKKVQLAYRVFKGQESLPLRAYVFTKFRVADAPEHIIPTSKREDMLRMWTGTEEGKARIEGDFFSSSRQLLSKLSRPQHALLISWAELRRLIPNLRLFRSMDPGLDHPTACCWAALAPNNVWYVYRFLSQRGLTIPARCERIIELSNNAREKVRFGSNPNDFYWQEVHNSPDSEAFVQTIGDYHLFEMDQTSGQNIAMNYAIHGLPLTESVHRGPEQRVIDLEGKLDPRVYPYHTHPVTGKSPGAGIYFLVNEPGVGAALDQMESLFWDMLQGGPNKGLAKDTVPTHGDDELDAVCQLTSSPIVWHPALRAIERQPRDTEPEEDLIQAAYLHGVNATSEAQAAHLAGLVQTTRRYGAGCF